MIADFVVHGPELLGALRWLVDDMTDAGEHANPETGAIYDSVQNAMDVLAKIPY